MVPVGPLLGLTVPACGAPSIRGMGKKNAAAGVGLGAVAATVTAANTRAVVRVADAWKPPLGHGRIHICRVSMPDYGLDRCMAITKRSISGSEKSVPAEHQQSKD